MKAIGIFVIIVLIIVLIYVRIQVINNRIKFQFGFKGIDLSSLNIPTLLAGGSTETTITISVKLINSNNFEISFSDLNAYLYYQDVLIGQTTDSISKQKVVVHPNASAEITGDIKIYLNPESIQLLTRVISKQSPLLPYTVRLKLYGVPISYSDSFVWEM